MGKCIVNGLIISVQVGKGTDIKTACTSAKELSEKINQEISFTFNGVSVSTVNRSINEMINLYNTQR